LERLTSKAVSGHCYKGVLEDREDEDPIILMEGMPVLVEWSKDIVVSALLLVHDVKAMEVVLEFANAQTGTTCKVYPDTSRLLKGYRPFVERLQRNPLALSVLEGQETLREGDRGQLRVDELRQGQEAALRSALTNRVLFIWGPPGTGKTYTLAALIAELALRGERVLATSISNRAVDELAQDVFDRLNKTEEGKALLRSRRVLRLGFAGSEVLEHDELFPHRIESQTVRQEIIKLKKLREESKSVEEKAGLQQQLTVAEDRLARIVKDSLGFARVVLTTVAQVALTKEFRACDHGSKAAHSITDAFDTVVCDEASMMNAAHLIPICWWGTKRVVIAGDHKQLGPVVISTSMPSLTHLHTSLFELELRRPEARQRIVQLTQQSRMHETICDLVSGPFYRGRLDTIEWNGSVTTPPLMLPNRLRAGLLFVQESETKMTKRGSRMNPMEAQVVMKLLKLLLLHDDGQPSAYGRIGIVTAYRAQAGHLRRLLKNEGLDTTNRVQVGTVHAFQGGEADAIIWNLVDARKLVMPDGKVDPKRKGKPGRLFIDRTGERLLNVAISRSKSAVYVVGDIELFLHHCPNPPMGGILRRIRDEGHVWEASILDRRQ
jgi:superfamily I DNA and/or RNA helicase